MTARTVRLPARWALGVLLAVLVSLSLLAHHELKGPLINLGVPMTASMTASEPRPADHGPEAMTPHVVAANTPVPVRCATMTCGSEAMCSAAGVAAPPLPAALPQATSVVAPAHLSGPVRPLPSGTGPPPLADTTSVLRI